MKRFLKAAAVVCAAVLLLTSAVVGVVAATTSVSVDTEYNRTRLRPASNTYAFPAQSKVVSTKTGDYFLIQTVNSDSTALAPVDSAYSVMTINDEGKKEIVFAGRLTYGSGELLVSGDTPYLVSGGSSWMYFNDRDEAAVLEVTRFNTENRIGNCVRSFCQLKFTAGSHYEFRSAALDEVNGKVYSLFVSQDGAYVSVATYDMASKLWTGLESFKTDVAVNHVFATSVAGKTWFVGQSAADSDTYLVMSYSAGALKQFAVKNAEGHTVDLVNHGEVYADKTGALHVISYDTVAGAHTVSSFTDAAAPASHALNLGNSQVRVSRDADGDYILVSVKFDENPPVISVAKATKDDLSDVTSVGSYTSLVSSALAEGSFQVQNIRSGSDGNDSITVVFKGGDYSILRLSLK